MIKKHISILLVLIMIIGMSPAGAFADDAGSHEFSDMPQNWSTAALRNAVKNGLLSGFDGRIMPEESLTRAQMATIVNRAFGAVRKADLSSYVDVAVDAWYYNEMAKALHMKAFGGYDGRMDPEKDITREEAFVVLVNVFKLPAPLPGTLDRFSDREMLSRWAAEAAASLVRAGYITGADGKLNPKQKITRAEFAQLMDNIQKHYIRKPGTYTENFDGNIMINVPGVTLKGITVKGDLIIGDSIGEGGVILDNVVVTGRTLIRGGESAIKSVGDTKLSAVIVVGVDGDITMLPEPQPKGATTVPAVSSGGGGGGGGGGSSSPTDNSAATVTPSTSTPVGSAAFSLGISSAKGTNGVALAGSIHVKITSSNGAEGAAGVVHDAAVSFAAGTATIPVTLTKPGAQTLTVAIAGVTAPKTVMMTVTAPSGTVVDIAAIAGVTAPVVGAVPVTAITETAQYTGSVAWSPADAAFGVNKTYTATITLTPKPGFTFTGVSANFFTVAGTSGGASNGADTGVITAAFPATQEPDTVYTYDTIDGGTAARITGYTGAGGTLTLPSTLGGLPVTAIGSNAFSGKAEITGVTIPDSVVVIGVRAFLSSGLTSVNLGAGLTTIELAAFSYTSLVNVTLPSSLTRVGQYAFGYCYSLTDVTLSNCAAVIDEYAFYECDNLAHVDLGNSVTKIENSAFEKCEDLTGIIIPDSVTRIGRYAFSECEAMTNVDLGTGVTSIDQYAFEDCNALTAVVIPPSITKINDYVFDSCESMTSVTIPNTVTRIGEKAFRDCYALTGMVIPDSVTQIGESAFQDCRSLTAVSLPSGLTMINAYLFSGCTALTSITIPDNVTAIEYDAFNGCSALSSVTMGIRVSSIGATAFINCTSLPSISLPGSVTTIFYQAFDGCPALTSVTIPAGVTLGGNVFLSMDSFNLAYVAGAGTYSYDGSVWTKQ